jgi:8-hydroxy-5-deazaflavin:NADPH oxidoreductase
LKIAILGGTGDQGYGLGLRWAAAGHEIIIGSRLAERGAGAAAELVDILAAAGQPTAVFGTDNLTASQQAELVVLSVPYAAQAATLADVKAALDGKILLTVVAPLGPEKKARVWRPPSGLSAAEEAQAQVGEGCTVVAAFQNVSAHHLTDLDHDIDCDVLVCGDKGAAKQTVIQLCQDAGMRGVNSGALQNAAVAEGLTAVLIAINIIHKVKDAGIRITGITHS